MTQVIYKYDLAVIDEQTLQLPSGAELLAVQEQYGQPRLWALVDTTNLPKPVRIRTVGTGHPFNDAPRWSYLGSYQLDAGTLVFHVFRERP